MNADREEFDHGVDADPVLDACLEEVLGGRTPPDLTARIVAALAAQNGRHAFAAGNGAGDHELGDHEVEAPPIAAGFKRGGMSPQHDEQPLVELASVNGKRKATSFQHWPLSAVALGTLGLAVALGVASISIDWQPELAKAPASGDLQADAPAGETIAESKQQKSDGVPPRRNVPLVGTDVREQIARLPEPKNGEGTVPPVEPAPSVAALDPSAAAEQPYVRPDADAKIVSFVNAELSRTWSEAGVKPSPAATDAEWCRRLFVRVLGRTPTADELASFTKNKASDRREKLVERLLSEADYVAEYAQHWATIWANALIGRTGGGRNSLASRDELEKYLRAALAENKPYDAIVRELVTATGSAKPGADDYNPAVNFLLDGLDSQATLATARVSRVFLGTQLQCAQCHTHPTQELSQDQYWALNSFFRQMKGERGENPKLTNVDFGGQGRNSQAGEVFFETPAGLLKSAYPKFIDGTAIPASGQLTEVDRRAELAKLVIKSDELPRATVNRVWAHFFGYGFSRQMDDVNASPAHPELLERLAEQFAAHDFDLKSAIRWIALSEPFARSSKLTDLATKDMPEAGEVALFSRYYTRPMQAEEVYNSLVQAAQIRKSAANPSELAKARVDWLAQFNRSMGTDDGQEETHFAGVRQSLMMMNGDLVRQAVSSQNGGILKSLAASEMKFEQKVEHLFLSALSRQASGRERQVAATILKNSQGDEAAALEDVWWAILNSNEFILDH